MNKLNKLSFNQEWRFFRGDIKDASMIDFKDEGWEVVNLPHTVRVEPANCCGGINYRGICWYRKHFYIEKSFSNKKVFVNFEGAKHITEVWINGEKVHTNYGGYLPFTIEIGAYLSEDKAAINTIAVRVDNNDYEDIPPGKPQEDLDFCYFGGLYRNVWLYAKEELHITDAVYANEVAGGGVFVRTEEASAEQAKLLIQTHVANDGKAVSQYRLHTELISPKGEVVGVNESEVKEIEAGARVVTVEQMQIQNPSLWHVDSPHLYKVVTCILVNDEIIDEEVTCIGIRRIAFGEKGFIINGEQLKLFGANRHQEYVYIGDALSDNMHRRDAIKLKEAGFNFVRTGHYPPGEAFIKACDEVGLLCVIPIPGWQWFRDNDVFKERSYQTVRDMIRRYRNHPSVAFWEPILNETKYTDEYALKTYEITHEEYPGDQCYAASDTFHPSWEVYDLPYNNGNYAVPEHKAFFIREYGDNYREQFGPQKTIKRCSRGDRDFYPGGETAMLKSALERVVQVDRLCLHERIAGGAIWSGIDCNRGYLDNLATTGVLDVYRLPKFSYYIFRSQQDIEKVIFIANYWESSATDSLVVFSNCEAVRLSINGKVIKEKAVSRSYLDSVEVQKNCSHFIGQYVNGVPYDMVDNTSKGLPHPPFIFENIKFEPGEVVAEGLVNGEVVTTHRVVTKGEAKYIELKLDECQTELVADGADTMMIHAFVKDGNGMVVTDCYEKMTFTIEGPAVIVGDQDERVGANPVTVEAGAIGVLIKAGMEAGIISVVAHIEGLESGKMTLTSNQDVRSYVKGPVQVAPSQKVVYEADKSDTNKKQHFNEFDRAAKKSIIASSELAEYPVSAIVDNNQETRWVATTDEQQWIFIDLLQHYDLTGCKIWWESDNTYYDYEILGSMDEKKWQSIVRRIGTGQDIKPDTFVAENVRYVKIVIYSVSKETASICGMQIFGLER